MTMKNEFCSVKCRNIDYARKKAESLTGEEGVDYVTCKWCGMKAQRLYLGHFKSHHPGKSTDDYRKEFPGAPLSCKKDNKNVAKAFVRFTQSDEGRKFLSDKVKGEKNPNSKVSATEEQRKSRSPFSVSYYTKLGFTEEEAKQKVSDFASLMAKERLTETQFEYWLNKTGGDEMMARELYKKRQSTFSLEKCILKYGEEKGRERWISRQKIWISSYRKKSYSFVSQDLFWKIQEKMQFFPNEIAFATFDVGKKTNEVNENKEAKLYLDNRLVFPDFIHYPSNKIIEFDGVYYHRNTPENKTREIQRDADLIRNGFQVFHVNEKEYREYPETVIEKCVNFLNA